MQLSASLAVHSNSEKLKFTGVSREEFFKEGCLHGYCWKTAACVYEHKYAALGMRWNRLNTIWFDPFTWFPYLFHNMFMLFARLGFSTRAQSPALMLFTYYWSHVFHIVSIFSESLVSRLSIRVPFTTHTKLRRARFPHMEFISSSIVFETSMIWTILQRTIEGVSLSILAIR